MLKLIKIKGSQNWYIRGTVKGQPVYQTTGTTDEKIADAERVRLEYDLLHQAVFGARKVVTFAAAAERYLDAGGSARFLGKFDPATARWSGVIGQFETTPLHSIGQAELDRAARSALPNAKPQTLNRQFYTPFIAVWNFAAQEDLCDARPWRRPQVKRSDKTRRKWFSREAAAQFFAACPAHMQVIFALCIYTGMRPIEAIELQAADVHLDQSWAIVRGTKTEGSTRGVPLHPALVGYLRKVLADGRTSVVLTPSGEAYKSNRGEDGTIEGGGQFKTSWAASQRRAGMSGYTPYSLRHTLNNWLVLAGVEQSTREAIMGHASDSTNAHYIDIPQQHLIDAVSKIPDFTDFSHAKTQNHVSFTRRSARKRTKAHQAKKPEKSKK